MTGWWRGSVLAKSPGLRRITLSTLLSGTADQFALIALIWLVFESTGSPAAMGFLVLCNRLPAVISAPLCGPRLDRGNAVRLVIYSYLIRALCLVAFPVLFVYDLLSLPVILVLATVIGAAYPLADVGGRTLIPRVVDESDLPSANGLMSMGDQFPYLIGPALGGAFVALAGPWSLLLSAAACLLAVLLMRGVRAHAPRPHGAGQAPSGGPAGWFGFRPLLSDPAVRALVLLTFVYFLAYGPLEPALPLYSRDFLAAGAVGYGLLWSAIGAGALAGLVTVPFLARRRPGVVNAMGAILWGVLLFPLILVDTLPAAMLILFVAGFVWAPYVATEVSVVQRRVPASSHGAVFGARKALLVIASPSGAAFGGLLLEGMSATSVILLSSVTCVLAGAVCLALPSVRAVLPPPRRPPPVPARPN
ncbi:MFS transporter [Nonomuraea candida]|uniref:MFS transporter n=1 Tax=Nonomuraea candida TaxID=359159 RepID=UPI000AF009DE|nr:MFS transporter [Nonomuraea candida]